MPVTRPTQAQIEAAGDLIDRLTRLSQEPHLKHLPLAEAAAALTAAAEVGRTGMDDWQDAHNAELQFAKNGPTGMEDMVAATIERCAHKLNEIADQMTDAVRIITLRNAAAAIRALKDKT